MKIMFVCTHNRCRSILAEAVTNHFGKSIISAVSSGSQPAGQVHPLSLKYLAEQDIPTHKLTSQSWDDFSDTQLDAIITVCDSAAGESCPLWMGKQTKVHWGLKDPSSMDGDEKAIQAAFENTIAILKYRISKLVTAIENKADITATLQALAKDYPDHDN